MTRNSNARMAGTAFLLYIVASITSMVIAGRVFIGDTIAAKLASVAQHQTAIGWVLILGLASNLAAFVLAVTLRAVTKIQDPDLAMLGMICRVAEGLGGMSIARELGLVWLATTGAKGELSPQFVDGMGAFWFASGAWNSSAVFFAVGSTLFAWLLLRGRMVPTWLAGLGLLASLLLVVVSPLQATGLLGAASWSGLVTWILWIPMLVYEVTLSLWFLIKGVAPAPCESRV